MPAGRGPGGASRKGRSAGRDAGKAATPGRYTPPIPRDVKVSPKWMGPTIIGLLVLGGLTIVLNYFKALPASPTNWYLLVGIALIACGFALATRYH
jgi:Cell division protein CrgA